MFFDAEVNERIIELQSLLNAYAESETAKFVTGARPLTEEELDAYFAELDELGYQEYLGYYRDYYANYIAQ